jgi:predicted nuclease of predicted toxin-antitoxin system
VVITVDKDFGTLAVALGEPHRGMVRLPDVPVEVRKRLMEQVLSSHEGDLAKGAIVTVSLHRIRVRSC